MNIYGGGILLNTHERVKYRPMNDDEIKPLFEKIKVNLNKEFSFPDKLIQDFINDGSMKPTFIKCTIFKNHHFNQLISHIKKNKMIKKLPPKPSSKKKNKKNKNDKNDKKKNDKNDKNDKNNKKKRTIKLNKLKVKNTT